MAWILFALAAPALYAASSFIDKYVIDKHVKSFATLTILGGCVALPFSFAIFAARGFPVYSLGQTALIILAGMCMELALLPYYKAISLDDVSAVVPTFQIIPVLLLLLSYVVLGERLTVEQFIGFWIIVIGAFLLSRESGRKLFAIKRSFGWVLLASMLWAIPVIIFKFVTVAQGFWDALAYEFLGASLGALVLFLIPRLGRGFVRDMGNVRGRVWGILVTNEFVYLFGRLLGFFAITIAPSVALASALGGAIPLFALVYGVILTLWFPRIIKEDIQRATLFTKLGAIILIFLGMWFVNA